MISADARWLQQARSHLRAADPVLARLIDDRPDFDPRAWMASCRPCKAPMAPLPEPRHQLPVRCRL
jgi:hypothetical protein